MKTLRGKATPQFKMLQKRKAEWPAACSHEPRCTPFCTQVEWGTTCPPAGQTSHVDGSWQGPHRECRGQADIQARTSTRASRSCRGPSLCTDHTCANPRQRHRRPCKGTTLAAPEPSPWQPRQPAGPPWLPAAPPARTAAPWLPAPAHQPHAPGYWAKMWATRTPGSRHPGQCPAERETPVMVGSHTGLSSPASRTEAQGACPPLGHTASCTAAITQAGLEARQAQKPVFWKSADPKEVYAPMDMWKEPQTRSRRPGCKAGCRPGQCVAS